MMHLTTEQVDHFIKYGFIHLEDCFSREFAETWIIKAWDRLDVDPNDSATWKSPFVRMRNENFVELESFSPKVFHAMCDLLGGKERIRLPIKWGDGFLINFSLGVDREWMHPSSDIDGWHKDGNFFYHFLDSPEQALLVIVIWKDTPPRGGGTFIAPDSIGVVAEHLLSNPQGIHRENFDFASLISKCTDFREITGKAGDVVLLHPFMLHASSQNHSGEPRFITNPLVSLKQPMQFKRAKSDEYSLTERAVLSALNVDYLEFEIQAERRHYS